MKTVITSLAALLLFAGTSNAAETKTNSAAESVENRMESTSSVTLASARSLAAIIEENNELQAQVSKMNAVTDDLKNKLDYTQMMHATISNLQNEVLNEYAENAKNQLDYARMMSATLVNLTNVLSGK